MPNKLITGPASEPITLTEAKAHLNVDTSDDDTYITTLITVAREQAEARQWRQLMTATREQVFDRFSSWALRLEYPPLQSVTSVKYIDLNGTQQTLVEGTDYEVNTDSLYGCVHPSYLQDWPATREVPSAVRVRYTCGYADADAVPTTTKQGMLLLIGNWYENREPYVSGTIISNIPLAVESLLSLNNVMRFA